MGPEVVARPFDARGLGPEVRRLRPPLAEITVLGIVVLPVAGLILRGRSGSQPAEPAELVVQVPAELRGAVIDRATADGISPQEFVIAAVRERLG